LYYVNDPNFFNTVIKIEEPPYEFKLNLFINSFKNDSETNQEQMESHIKDICKLMKDKLEEFDAKSI
jgi:hypothetical protein